MQIELSKAEHSVTISEVEVIYRENHLMVVRANMLFDQMPIPTTAQENKLEEEINVLLSEMASQEEKQAAVLKAINELEVDKGEF